MTVFEPTAQARAAAARAAMLAGIARRRTLFASASNNRALLFLADLLDMAALSLYEEAPEAADDIPFGARLALESAEEIATENPGIGFPAGFGRYVTHPVDGRPLPTPAALGGVTSSGLADDDARLASALGILHVHLVAPTTEEVAQALLEAVFVLHDKRADLAQFARG